MVTKTPAASRSGTESRWQTGYALKLLATDAVVVTGSVLLAQHIRFGTGPLDSFGLQYTTLSSAALALLWLAALSIFQSRSSKVLGVGLEEYRRVINATFWIFGVVAIAALLMKLSLIHI